MIDPEIAIQGVRSLINVPSVKALVSTIAAGELSQVQYNSLANAKSRFIVVNCKMVTFADVQRAFVNVNLYAPKTSNGTTDYPALKEMLLAVKPLLENAGNGNVYCFIDQDATIEILDEPSINYSFYNLKVDVRSVNIEKQTNY